MTDSKTVLENLSISQVRDMLFDKEYAAYRYRRPAWNGQYIFVKWQTFGKGIETPSLFQSQERNSEIISKPIFKEEDIFYEDWEAYLPDFEKSGTPVEVQDIANAMKKRK